MTDEATELWNRINQLSDEELIDMVEVNYSQFREEALIYAEAELQRRGLRPAPGEERPTPEASYFFSDGLEIGDAGDVGDVDERDERDERDEGHSDPAQPVAFKVFRGPEPSSDELFIRAAEFAGSLRREQVISISHAAGQGGGVVTVWYWA